MKKQLLFLIYLSLITTACVKKPKINNKDSNDVKVVKKSNICSGIDLILGEHYFRSELLEQLAHIERTNDLKKLLPKKNKIYHLNLSALGLTKLPEEIFQFNNLQTLDISSNNFLNKEKLFEDLAKFPNLKVLKMVWSKMTKLPKNIKLLSNLEVLSLASNNISVLSEEIGGLRKLKALGLSNNKRLKNLPSSIKNLKCLQLLNVSGTGLTRISDELTNCNELVIILANASKINTISDSIGKLSNLRNLNIAANKIVKLPKSIGGLTNLEKLSLSSNDLEYLPEEISKLKKLKFISLEFNRFKEFPKQVLGLDGVYNLWVHNNSFKVIPEEVADMKSITHLLVDHEIITDMNIEQIKARNPKVRVIREDTRKYVKGRKRKI